ncbi:ABC transporter substrate-binding protein [Xylophilus sp. ASV27]|uniref:ABC transporter substrate-binding protein n=1 Tax=Xylophilus sp. ASV27 TaxID=2795129 RepID=UPI0018EC4876|nr:ABC transporter substrate-binding protein [Xylophilus sp. ASV27]
MQSIQRASRLFAAALLSLCAAAQAQDLPVVSIQAVTGTAAFSGVHYKNAIRLAIDEVNARGGVNGQKINLIERDNASDKGQAINLANQAIDRDNALLVLGPSTTADSVAVAPIFNDRKTPFLSFATSEAILKAGPWSLKMQQAPAAISPLMARYVLEKTPIRKVAIVFDRTNEGLIEYKNFFRDPFKAGGGTVATEEAVVSADSNFQPLATKLKAQEVDAVYLGVYTEQAANIIQQLSQSGLDKVRYLGPITLASAKFIAMAGKAGEGTITVSDYVPGLDRPLNKSFEAAFQARYGAAPDAWGASGYTLAQVAIAALKEAGPGPTREKVRDAFQKLRDVPIVSGSGLWNQQDRRPQFGAVVQVVRDGKLVAQ